MTDVETRFKPVRIRSRAHLHFVSYCGCVVPGCRHHNYKPLGLIVRALRALRIVKPEPNPYVTWHHVRRSSNAGTAVKPGDDETVGACATHHFDIHNDGEKTCAARWGIDLMEKANELAAASRSLGLLPPSDEP